MNCDQARERMVDRWVAGVDEAQRIELDAHIRGCPECRTEWEALDPIWHSLRDMPVEEPGRNMRASFYHMLEAYQLGASQAKPVTGWDRVWRYLGDLWPRRPMLQLAFAGTALILGIATGHLYTARTQDAHKITQLSSELQNMRQLVALSMLQQQSATDRLRGVSWSAQLGPSSDEQVIDALLTTLNTDTNVNVRLAAVDALRQFANRVPVRRGLRESIIHQDSPLVQIALIDWAVESTDAGSIKALEELNRQAELNPAVKVRLASALSRLRPRGEQ